jgi:hypothetical protein
MTNQTQLNQHRLYVQDSSKLLTQSTRLPNYQVIQQFYSIPHNRLKIVEHWKKSNIIGFYQYNYQNNEITYTRA